VAKHAEARAVELVVSEEGGGLAISVVDDGRGFDPGIASGGFGMAGMRERVLLAGGTLSIDSGPGGTSVRATLPARRGVRAAGAMGSGADQAAS
jgi:signal transduction histidine kinase